MPKLKKLTTDVYLSNPKIYKHKIAQLKKHGAAKLHLISDFDLTLTHEFIEGRKTNTSFGLVRESGLLGETFSQRLVDLYNHYRPIELDPNIPHEERNAKMIEWWSEAFEEMNRAGMCRDLVDQLLTKEKFDLRAGADELFSILQTHNIPTLIFSGGFGDLIQSLLIRKKVFSDNVHLLANFLEFDSGGEMIGYKNPLIHSLNKASHLASHTEYNKKIANRTNLILLGDIIDDAKMADQLIHDTALKIGFLNNKVEEKLEDFIKTFDIIIMNDSSTDFINQTISDIIQS